MRCLSKLLAWLIPMNMLCMLTKADLPPGTLELINNNEVEELDLSGYGLSSDDIRGIGVALKLNTALKKLILVENYLDNSCREEIISIMCANNTLEELDLIGNFMGERCIKEAIEFAKKLGIKWVCEEGNRFCLKRVLRERQQTQRFALEDLDEGCSGDKGRKLRELSSKWEKKAKAQEIKRARTDKESEQEKIYDQERPHYCNRTTSASNFSQR